MSSLTFKFLVEFPGLQGLQFLGWLPSSEDDAINVQTGKTSLTLAFPQGIAETYPSDWGPEISISGVMTAYRLLCKVILEDITEELSHFISLPVETRMEAIYSENQRQVEEICKGVFEIVTTRVNRLIVCARVLGQFTLEEMPYLPYAVSDFFRGAMAELSVCGSTFEPFVPSLSGVSRAFVYQGDYSFIHKDVWPGLKEFVAADERPPLLDVLLSNAKELAYKGHRRSALIEAVVVLELALAEFVRRGKRVDLPDAVSERIDAGGAKQLIEKLGLRGTFNLLIPLIFSEEDMPLETIRHCRKAIDMRNNVIHNGQRDVPSEKLREWINGIEDCCRRLLVEQIDATTVSAEAGALPTV